jgi:multiple sugar transport system ATP-binding protein
VIDLGFGGRDAALARRLGCGFATHSGEVFYGFRPEQAALAAGGAGMAMPVNFVERIGARTIVHLGQAEQSVKACLDNDVGLNVGMKPQ